MYSLKQAVFYVLRKFFKHLIKFQGLNEKRVAKKLRLVKFLVSE